MLIVHRITPVVIALVSAGGAYFLFSFPSFALMIILATLVVSALLFSRLMQWKISQSQFWIFLLVPFFLILSSFLVLLFLEAALHQFILVFVMVGLSYLFAEHVFVYLHLPTTYRPYSIEYLTLIVNLVSIFQLAAAGFAFRLFLQAPLLIVVPLFFISTFLLLRAAFWVGKTDKSRTLLYSFAGTCLFTELFTALMFLPSSFFSNAAILAIVLYVFLGMTRAHFFQKLSKLVFRRYALISILLIVIVIGTARWV